MLVFYLEVDGMSRPNGVGNGAANGAEVSSLAKCGAGGAKKRNESKNERRKLKHF